MRRVSAIIMALLLACGAALTGCAPTLQPETQAFVMSMSVDMGDEDQIELGVLMPSITGGGNGAGEGGDSDYMRYYATAGSFNAALNTLQSIMPFTLNLSQLVVVVISRELAESDRFARLIQDMMLTNHLYSTTYVAISLTPAKGVLEAEKRQVAGRLSVEIQTAYRHFSMMGYVPLTLLSDMYYNQMSFLGEDYCMLVSTVEKDHEGQRIPLDEYGKSIAGEMPVDSPARNQYMGSALFRGGRMVGTLDGLQTRWARVLQGEIVNFAYNCQGLTLQLLVSRFPKIRVDLSGGAPKITIDMALQMAPMREAPDRGALEAQIRAEVSGLLAQLRALGVDPLHFSEHAVSQFLTIQQFEDYNWLEKMRNAEFELIISFQEPFML